MTANCKVLLISNGHGEDVVAAHIARALTVVDPSVDVTALATVGNGASLKEAGCRLLDAGPTLPSGGMTLESPSSLVRDLRAGLLSGLRTQWKSIRDVQVDAVISVGDVWAEILAASVRADRRLAVQTLVSSRMQGRRVATGRQAFRERITFLERTVLNRWFERVFVRDADTKQRLQDQGVPHASFVGNAMMDGLKPKDKPGQVQLGVRERRVLLLPGTRESADSNLAFMMDVVRLLGPANVKVAWARPQPPTVVAIAQDSQHVEVGQAQLAWTSEPFGELIAWAGVALGSTGTAVEQTAGVGTPVVTFPSPSMRQRFFENQARLLGDAIKLESRDASSVANTLNHWLQSPRETARRAALGIRIMGPPGAANAIAQAALKQEVTSA